MSFIKLLRLAHEFINYDEEGNEEDKVRAIEGIDAEISEGEFVAILGHNGSGKSTLAKHLNALLFPAEGTVWIDGYDTKDQENLLKIRQTTGMVFQNPDNQIIGSVVEEDVAFGLENIGTPTQEIVRRVSESLVTVGMDEYRSQSPNRLSGGQKQRVAIAGVVAMKPKCIVLDESTAMLDPVGRRDVMNTVQMLNRTEGITVILITHYMEEAVMADRILVMNEGHLAMEGSPREIFAQVDQLKAYHLDVPQVTELAHELRREGLDLPEDILTTEEMVEHLCRLG